MLVKLIMREMAMETPSNIDILFHHIEVNWESLDDMVCDPPTTTRETMQIISLQIKSIKKNFTGLLTCTVINFCLQFDH